MGREQDGRTPEGEKGRGKVCLKYRMGRSIVDYLLQALEGCEGKDDQKPMGGGPTIA
jgi:hypothetical protein